MYIIISHDFRPIGRQTRPFSKTLIIVIFPQEKIVFFTANSAALRVSGELDKYSRAHARTHAREQDVRRGESVEVQASVGSGSTMKWTRRVYAGGRRWQVINVARRVSIHNNTSAALILQE